MALKAGWQDNKFGVGDTIRVHQKIKEGEKKRMVAFEGMVISIRGRGVSQTFTLRRLAVDKIGVEKVFPLALPTITKIEIKKRAKKIRRAKLFHLRKQKGKK